MKPVESPARPRPTRAWLRTGGALGALLVLLAFFAGSAEAQPRGFFGIVPQTVVTPADAQYMSVGGIESIRVPVPWPAVQPTSTAPYQWSFLDETVAVADRAGLQVLPFLAGTPSWLEARNTTLPVGDPVERGAWTAFVEAAVRRYGPNGAFWQEHGATSPEPLPERPIRLWQIWNEANFHYFAFPVSPSRYGMLVRLTAPAIRSVDPGARILLSGLFGNPEQTGRNGIPAAQFLARLYQVRGIRQDFDAVALHPYAPGLGALRKMVEGIHLVLRRNHDSVPLYITEMGWGSQNDPRKDAFEQGAAGQARELTRAYRYLLANRGRLNLRGVYWFSWKDASGACDFCDSVGLFRAGSGFDAKPAWNALVRITGGLLRP
jgi:hypothetical protein